MKKAMIAQFFQFSALRTNFRLEFLAGLSTFLTMSYIIFLNAHILEAAGMNFGAVFVATCLTAALGSFLVGILANYPIAVAPGMALNVYFSFIIVQMMGYSWQAALAMTFIASCLFLILSLSKTLLKLIDAVPDFLHLGLTAGIGIFICLIGLHNAGILQIQGSISLLTQNFYSLQTVIFLLGFILLLILEYYKLHASIIISILFITLLSLYYNLTQFHGVFALPPSISPTLFKLDFHELLSLQSASVIFVLFLIILFDATGTFIGLLNNSDTKMPRALFADSISCLTGALIGTSSTSPFIESAVGIRVGGRSGLTSVVVAILFLLALFIFPLVQTIPNFATAPALLYVGLIMTSCLRAINFKNYSQSLPIILTVIVIPLRFSIADGICAGVLSYSIIQFFTPKAQKISSSLIILCSIFIIFLVLQLIK